MVERARNCDPWASCTIFKRKKWVRGGTTRGSVSTIRLVKRSPYPALLVWFEG